MLRSSEQKQLNYLVKLRHKKKNLIDRLSIEKEEDKMRAMEDKILQQTLAGSRRA